MEQAYAELRHRKLCHTLSREGKVWALEWSVLRVLRSEGLVSELDRRSRPKRVRPDGEESRPNRSWRYDITRVPTRDGDWFWVPILDACSRKICGWTGDGRSAGSVRPHRPGPAPPRPRPSPTRPDRPSTDRPQRCRST